MRVERRPERRVEGQTNLPQIHNNEKQICHAIPRVPTTVGLA